MQLTRVVLAALVALGIALVPVTPASAHGNHPGAAASLLIPAAGWHGRAIENTHRHAGAAADRSLRGWSAGPVAFGAGYHRPGGSDRVREVQRRLHRLGYRPGPIDGLFGPLTRSSVAWFQVKHGLPVNGRATLATVRHLRARTGASDPAPAERAIASTVAARPQAQDTRSITPSAAATESGASPIGWIAGAALLLLLVAAAFLLRRQRGPARSEPAQPSAQALAYVLIPADEPDDLRFRSHAASIEAESAERGLAVVGFVADVEDSRLIWQRPGLASAVRRLVDGEVDFLMVTKIEDATDADLERLMVTTEGEIAIARWQQAPNADERELSNA